MAWGDKSGPVRPRSRHELVQALLEAIVATDILHHVSKNRYDPPRGVSIVLRKHAVLYEPFEDLGYILSDLPVPDPAVMGAYVAEDYYRAEVCRELRRVETAVITEYRRNGVTYSVVLE